MRARQLTPSVVQLTRLRFVNAYLLREDDGFKLFDTTVPRGAGALLEAAQKAGGPIRRIVLTHGHGDHVGSLDDLSERLDGELEVSMPELDARIHAGEQVVDGKLPGSWPDLETDPDRRLEPGDRVGSLEVVGAPGHTPGHVACLDMRDRILLAVRDPVPAMDRAIVKAHRTLC
jgi:glyoxylase-like metal-dependent hydrolase (beta-lactamase superfamily II)